MPLRRRVVLGSSMRYALAVVGLLLLAGAAVILISGSAQSHRAARSAAVNAARTTRGALPTGAQRRPAPAPRRQPAGATVGADPSRGRGGHRTLAVEQPDPYAAQSFPVTHSSHSAAATPATAGSVVAPGAPSDSQVQQELAQMQAATKADGSRSTPTRGGSIGGNGAFTPPANIPAVVARVIAGGNAIADFPYVYGGGHASFVDNAYDCSGSVSYALAAGGLLTVPETSGQLESWGAPGPGRWITVEAAGGHTYMYVAGLRFDTAGRSGPYSSRWQSGILTNAGFVTRHPPGL